MTIFVRNNIATGGGATFTGTMVVGTYNFPLTAISWMGFIYYLSVGSMTPSTVSPTGTIYSLYNATNNNTDSQFTGSISGNTLTVSSVVGAYPNPSVGQVVVGNTTSTILPGTYIVSGTYPTYTLNTSQTVGSTSMASYNSAGLTLEITGFSYNPTQNYFNLLTVNSLSFNSSFATYSYSSGTATWEWSPGIVSLFDTNSYIVKIS